MRRIQLTIEGQRFYIDECDGRAEIWRADESKSHAGARCEAYIEGFSFATGDKVGMSIDIAVEFAP